MCGRYALPLNSDAILAELDLHDWPDAGGFVPGYNLAPTRDLPVLMTLPQPGIRLLRWGLVPRWASDPAVGAKMINARSETVATKPAYRDLVARQHCVAMASGYYEWRDVDGRKLPVYLHDPAGRLLLFAGLWDTWRGGTGPPLRTFTIITTEPAPGIAHIHDRMPVILTRPDADAWLAAGQSAGAPGTPVATAPALALLRPYAGELAYHSVAPLVNHVRNDSPALIAPVADEPPAQLDLFG